jgi:hypothetical protein
VLDTRDTIYFDTSNNKKGDTSFERPFNSLSNGNSIFQILIQGHYKLLPIAVGVENPHKFWMCRQPLVNRFPLPPLALSIGDTSFTHVMKLAAHSITSPTPTAMGQSFIMTCIYNRLNVLNKLLHPHIESN